jgi:hypothetical protein
MTSFKEHRLIYATSTNVAARKAARLAGQEYTTTSTGVKTTPVVTTPVTTQRINPRSAEQQVAQQDAQHLNALSQNTGTVKSYIDPSTGLDTRFVINEDVYGDEDPETGEKKLLYEAGTDTRKLDPNDPNYGKQISSGTLGTYNVQGPLNMADFSDIGEPDGVSTRMERDVAGAPLQYQQSGAMGQAGATGFSGGIGGVGIIRGKLQALEAEENNVDNIQVYKTVEFTTRSGAQGTKKVLDPIATQEAKDKALDRIENEKDRLYEQVKDEEQRSKQESISESTVQEKVTPEESAAINQKLAGWDAVLANLSKNSPEAQALMPVISQLKNDIATQMSQNREFTEKMLAKNQENMESSQASIEALKNDYKSNATAIQELLEEARDDTAETLAAQQESQMNQTIWAEEGEAMRIKKLEVAQRDAMVVNFALQGGFGQPQAMSAVAESDRYFEEQYNQIKRAYMFKRTDIAAKFAGLFSENKQNYISNTISNAKETMSAIERLTTQGDKNTREYQTAENNILTNWFNNQNTLMEQSAKANMDGAAQMQEVINEKEKQEREEKNEAMQNMIDTFKNFEAGSSMRQLAIDNAKDAGWNVDEININDDTMVSSAKSEKKEAEELVSSLSRKNIEGAEMNLGLLAARALARRTTRQRIDEAPMMHDMIDSGDEQALKDQILITANNGFDTTSRRELDAITEANTDIDFIYQQLAQWDDKYGGISKAVVEGSRKFYNSRDEDWQALKASIGSNMAETRKKFAGVAVTDTELAQLELFLPSFKFDTVKDMKIKFDEAKQNLLIAEQSKYNRLLGDGAFQYLTGRGLDVTGNPKTQEDTWNDDQMRIGLPSQKNNNPTSMRTDRNNNPTALAWSSGVENFFKSKGYKVAKGDAFPDNPNAFTINMTNVKDPIKATIDYIDSYTFFYNGNPRWNHTAIPQDEWDTMNEQEKKQVIKDMYRKEGGSELSNLFV